MSVIGQIVGLIAQFEPELQQLVLELVQIVRSNLDGKVTAEQATADANQRLSLLLGRLDNVPAQEAAVNAVVDAEATAKLKT